MDLLVAVRARRQELRYIGVAQMVEDLVNRDAGAGAGGGEGGALIRHTHTQQQKRTKTPRRRETKVGGRTQGQMEEVKSHTATKTKKSRQPSKQKAPPTSPFAQILPTIISLTIIEECFPRRSRSNW